MHRLKLTTLCLLMAACAVTLSAVPRDAAAQGICGQIKKQVKKAKFPAKGCVTRKDVRKNSLTHKDLKNEAGFNFVEGKSFDRETTTEFSNFATLDLVAPAFGHIVVTAYVTMSTLLPQRNGGALECQIVTDKLDGKNLRTPGPSVSGTVVDSRKDVEEMIWTETHQVQGGLSRFKLQCKQIHETGTKFGANSFMMAEYYPLRY